MHGLYDHAGEMERKDTAAQKRRKHESRCVGGALRAIVVVGPAPFAEMGEARDEPEEAGDGDADCALERVRRLKRTRQMNDVTAMAENTMTRIRSLGVCCRTNSFWWKM